MLDRIDAARPDIVWVGLGTPKQDHWVANHRPLLGAPVLIAIGAAFDFHAGVLKQAPPWMQRGGLEWLYRFGQEPRRLAYRYLVLNPLFVVNTILQATRLRRFGDDTTDSPLQLPSERRLTTFRTTRQDHLGLKLLELPASFGREFELGHLG